ncbi:MAG: hypothetical protein ABIL37_06170 [candidate division WOR-3 bacterium]
MDIILALFSYVKTIYFVNDISPIKIIKDADNYYLTGVYQSNSFIIKLNSYKVPVWSKIIYNVTLSEAIISKDTIILFSNFPLFSIVKLNSNGDLISFSSYDIQNTSSLQFFADIFGNSYLIAHNYLIKLKNNIKVDWIKSYSNVDFCKGTHDFYLFCRYNFNAPSILKVDQDGNLLKAKTFGIYSPIFPIEVFLIDDKIYAFAQYTDISLKYYIWIVCLDSFFNVIWSKVYKPFDNLSLYVTDIEYVNNQFIISGNYFNEIFFFSIDMLGNIIFSRRSNTLSFENNPKLNKNTIYFYKQDSLAIFDFDLNDGSNCYYDTLFNIVSYDIYSEVSSDITINVDSVNAIFYQYPITQLDFLPYEKAYCKVSIDELENSKFLKCDAYNINGRYVGSDIKNLNSGIYIKNKRKFLKF